MKILLIGLGMMGINHYRILNLLLNNNKDLLLFDKNRSKLNFFLKKQNNLKQDRNLDNLIRSADRVIIASDTSSHYELVLKCIKNGAKTIFIEKPYMKDLNEAQKINKILKKNSVKIFVGLIERFNSSVLSLQHYLKNKKIYHFEATRTARVPSRNKDIDVVKDLMIHDLDLAIKFNGKIKNIDAVGIARNKIIEYAKVNILHINNSISTLTASRITDKKIRMLNFLGKDFFIEANLLEQELNIYKNAKYNITKDTRYKVTNFLEKIQANPTEPLLSEINKFLNMKEKEFKNLSYCSYEYNLNLLKYCEIIQMKII
jgi:predicted dehydrogenase